MKEELKSNLTDIVAEYCISNNIPVKGDVVKLKSYQDCKTIITATSFNFQTFDISKFTIEITRKDGNESETIVLTREDFDKEFIRQVITVQGGLFERLANSDEFMKALSEHE